MFWPAMSFAMFNFMWRFTTCNVLPLPMSISECSMGRSQGHHGAVGCDGQTPNQGKGLPGTRVWLVQVIPSTSARPWPALGDGCRARTVPIRTCRKTARPKKWPEKYSAIPRAFASLRPACFANHRHRNTNKDLHLAVLERVFPIASNLYYGLKVTPIRKQNPARPATCVCRPNPGEGR